MTQTGAQREHQRMYEQNAVRAFVYRGLPALPTGVARGPADLERPVLSAAAKARRLRVSIRVIAERSPIRLKRTPKPSRWPEGQRHVWQRAALLRKPFEQSA